MIFRRAVEADASGVAEVHVRSWRSAYRGVVPDAYLAGLSVEKREQAWREAFRRGSPELWVASNDAGVGGWIAFGSSRDPDAAATVGEVEAIYVAPEHWSAGVGRTLWFVARRRLMERKFESVTLWVLEENARAIRFYRAAGFSLDRDSRKQINVGGKGLWEVRYRRALLLD